jgi:arginine N-succinyltransferase
MLIAAARDRFADKIVSELRGWFDWEGESPFWEGVSAKFFRLPFEEADRMITASNGQFLVDLAPRHPIYLELIEPFARDVIGEVHPDGRAARKMLESEGFSWTGLVDVFDGGPTVTCARDKIDTIRRTTPCTVAVNDNAPPRLRGWSPTTPSSASA